MTEEKTMTMQPAKANAQGASNVVRPESQEHGSILLCNLEETKSIFRIDFGMCENKYFY